MMSATPIPEKPLLRNNSPAVSIMRSRFAAACSRLTLMTHLSYAAEEDGLTVYMMIDMNSKYDDDHHLTAPGRKFQQGHLQSWLPRELPLHSPAATSITDGWWSRSRFSLGW